MECPLIENPVSALAGRILLVRFNEVARGHYVSREFKFSDRVAYSDPKGIDVRDIRDCPVDQTLVSNFHLASRKLVQTVGNGAFRELCRKCQFDPRNSYLLLEIGRLAKVFSDLVAEQCVIGNFIYQDEVLTLEYCDQFKTCMEAWNAPKKKERAA